MIPQFIRFFRKNFPRFLPYFLALIWGIGFLSGMLIAQHIPDAYLSMMAAAAGEKTRFVSHFVISLLPMLAAVTCVYFAKPGFLYLIGFLKALSFSLCAMCIYRFFGSAGWLIHGLFQLSDTLLLPVLYWFSLRHLSAVFSKKDTLFCFLTFAGIVYLDHCFVSPFLAMLIEI